MTLPIVGTIPNIFSTGELTYLPWQIYRGESKGPNASLQKLCSCSKGFYECETWHRIISILSQKKGFNIFKNPFSFKINLLQNERYFRKRFDFERLNRSIFFQAIHLKMRFIIDTYKYVLKESIINNWLLYDTICDCTKSKFVTDSSKSVCRLLMLFTKRPANIYALFLVRDLRAVAYSEMKLGNDPVMAYRGLVRQYKRMFKAFDLMENIKILPVKYENYVSNVKSARIRISNFLGLKNIPEDFIINKKEQHLVAGNGMRHKGIITLKHDNSWKRHMPVHLIREMERIKPDFEPRWQNFLEI